MQRKIPKLCTHRRKRPDGSVYERAYVTDPRTGDEVYFGPAGSAEALEGYRQWVHEFTSRMADKPVLPRKGGLVNDLLEAYLAWAEGYYRKGGKETSEVRAAKLLMRTLCEEYGTMPITRFGIAELKTIRQAMIEQDLTRRTINQRIRRLVRIFRWGVEEGVVPATVLHELKALKSLPKDRIQGLRDKKPIPPVPMSVFWATLELLPPKTRALAEVHYLLGCRAGEVVMMRPCDLDRAESIWIYTPESHKTQHRREGEKQICIGRRAQEVLLPWLSAAEAVSPETWIWMSRGRGRNKQVQGHITVDGYNGAIERACKRGQLPHWSPLQVRHARLTEVRKKYGLEAAQVIGDHAQIETTQIYAERNAALAAKVAGEIG